MCSEDSLEQVLCAPVCLPVFCSLSAGDLVRLEASCLSFHKTLQSELATIVWATCAHAASNKNRINLPMHVLAAMPLKELKMILRKTRRARGSLNCRTIPLFENMELRALLSVCTTSLKEDDLSRVVVARLHFDQEGLAAVAAVSKGQEAVRDEELFCFSSEMVFWWPGNDKNAGTMLTVALGCGSGINLLEVCSVIKPLHSDLSLTVDLHLAHPGQLGQWSVMGLEADVNRRSAMFCIPQMDLAEEKTRQCLACTDGVLAALVVRASSLAPTFPAVVQNSHDGVPTKMVNSRTSLNALALELPKRPHELN